MIYLILAPFHLRFYIFVCPPCSVPSSLNTFHYSSSEIIATTNGVSS